MTQDKNNPPQNDQIWFDALSGKVDEGQGARLRKVLCEVELADAAQETTEHDWQRLQFSLMREKSQRVETSHSGLRYFALAASVLILVGTVTMLMPSRQVEMQSATDDDFVMRGQTQRMVLSANPEQIGKQLESELNHLGVQVVRRSTEEKTELNITLSYPVSDDVRAVLEAHIIPVPEQGGLKVLFIKAPQ